VRKYKLVETFEPSYRDSRHQTLLPRFFVTMQVCNVNAIERYLCCHSFALLLHHVVSAGLSQNAKAPTPMTTSDAARIQSAAARAGDGGVEKGSFPARAQAAAAKNDNAKGGK
jgi:Seed maturation protein